MKTVDQLYKERPRSLFARVSAVVMLVLIGIAWTSEAVDFGALFAPRAQANLDRFLVELRPHPLQKTEWDWGVAWDWFRGLTEGKLGGALVDTLSFSIAAVVLAGLLALAGGFFAARNIATPEPFLPGPSTPSAAARFGWSAVVWVTRYLMIFVRAVPEYVWAFVLLTLLGPSAWPGVLALALHNSGILGRLFAEVVENGDPRTPGALRALGAGRLEIATHAIWPASLNRFLLFFFYRWETCVREATILGLLGFGGLGYYILQAKAGIKMDEMLLWTLMGSALIVIGDLVSAWARATIRHAAS
ncbi:MAG: ABC transporter permease subunit [Planctomycetota bacterium]